MNMLVKVLFVIMSPMGMAMAQTQTINFDNFKIGDSPSGWTATKTGSGQAKWTIERDDTAPSKPNVLKQSGEATYPVCIKDDAMVQGEIVATADQLQRLLKALRAKRLDLISIRNHAIAEHPQLVFVRFVGSGSAMDLAKAVRYSLDMQIGTIKPAA